MFRVLGSFITLLLLALAAITPSVMASQGAGLARSQGALQASLRDRAGVERGDLSSGSDGDGAGREVPSDFPSDAASDASSSDANSEESSRDEVSVFGECIRPTSPAYISPFLISSARLACERHDLPSVVPMTELRPPESRLC